MARFSLTHKTLIFLIVIIAVIITLRVGSTRLIILKEFAALEEELTRQNMERLLAALDREYQGMARIMGDWGAWTDTLDFIQGRNPSFAADNLTPDAFANLDLHLVVLADRDGRFHLARSRSQDGKSLPPLDPETGRYLMETEALWKHTGPDSRRAGLLQTPMGLMLVAAGPIVNSKGEGPAGGTIVMARRFGPEAVAALEKKMRMAVSIAQIEGGATDTVASPHDHPLLVHGTIRVAVLDEARLVASAVVNDLAGRPTIELAARLPRHITAKGHSTLRHFLFWQAFVGLLVTLMILIFVRRVILIPIARLSQQVSAIAARSSFTDRLEVTSEDEVGEVSEAINRMLSALEIANTKLQAAYDELKDTQAQLIQSAKLASIGELAAGVAHELNQPLMVIRGTAQMIGRSLVKDNLSLEALPGQLDLVERNTKRMMNIIEHLRAFSRQSDQAPAPTDINQIIGDSLLLLGEQLRVHAIDIELDLAPGLPLVLCKRSQMEQVLVNLITNAQDAILERRGSCESELRGRLQVSTASVPGPQERVEIRVKDNGGGIAEDRLDWIFDPFFTTKPVGQGTGLGLSISYGIVQGHKGELRVDATGPEGTTFVLQLPVQYGLGEAPMADLEV